LTGFNFKNARSDPPQLRQTFAICSNLQSHDEQDKSRQQAERQQRKCHF
jgi:hypothetical protein